MEEHTLGFIGNGAPEKQLTVPTGSKSISSVNHSAIGSKYADLGLTCPEPYLFSGKP
ncbi:hypothetical protein ACLOJK_040259 [Asimina triloba]